MEDDEKQLEFHDAPDDFPFFDCEESFPDPISNPNSFPGDSPELPSVSSDPNFMNSSDIKLNSSTEIYESEKKLENENLNHVKNITNVVNYNDQNDETSTITTDTNNTNRGDYRDNDESHSSFLFTLAKLMINVLGFQVKLVMKLFTTPLWLVYDVCTFVFDPFGFIRRFLIRKTRSVVYRKVWPVVNGWLSEHRVVWRVGLKFGWGLLWSGYVCVVLVVFFVLAFVIGGFVTKGVVEEPVSMMRSLNFDYTEKTPVAFVPMVGDTSRDVFHGDESGVGKRIGSRVVPANHKLMATVALTLPESDYNQNLGIFQVRVDFLSNDGNTLASSRRTCMLQYRSLPIRLLLTSLKVVPILTGYTSETQDLKIKFRGFTEGDKPTAGLRVVIEPRAEFMPGAGIPEIYTGSLTLESEIPFLRKIVWVWKKTVYVWISMAIFTMELFFALICCKPIIFPRIRLKDATDREGPASQSDQSHS